jgi:hypothetical protein
VLGSEELYLFTLTTCFTTGIGTTAELVTYCQHMLECIETVLKN